MSKTTKMLIQAMAAAQAGGTVLVIAHDDKEAKDLTSMLWASPVRQANGAHATLDLTNREISFFPQGQIRFRGADHPEWDAKGKRMRGYPPLPVFIDGPHSEDDSKCQKNLFVNRESSSTKESPSTSKTSDSSSTGHSKH